MLRYVIRNRDWLENAILAQVLPFVAGSVNASGFMMLGVYTSHVTGNVARFGDELAQGRTGSALVAVYLILCFFFGAVTATALVAKAKRQRRARYAGVLAMETFALAVVLALSALDPIPEVHAISIALLGFSMGGQNALVTKLSGAVVRTTHMTGVVTDLGIETVRLAEWLREHTRGMSLAQRLAELWRLRGHGEFKRLRLHLAIFGSFVAGAVIGPALYVRAGRPTMLLPIFVLVGLVVFDSLIGFRDRDQHSQAPTDAEAAPGALARTAASANTHASNLKRA